jgi:phosphoribosyl 1,2-cyclic phosphate phosphodiesterase
MIETGGRRIVIDCGPDFRQQMLRENIKTIDAILITHGHKDHIGGLDDVRAFNYKMQKPVDVWAAEGVLEVIRHEFSYAFEKDKYPGAPEIILHPFNNHPFEVCGIRVVPIRARHFREQYVYGFRVGELTYITDAVEISDEEKMKMAGSRVIVINALRKKKHYSHFNLEEALSVLNELKPEKGFLTHISDQMGTRVEVEPELPGFVRFASDRLSIEV